MNLFNHLAQIAYAENTAPPAVKAFAGKINRLILNPLIVLMFTAAMVYFIYGVFNFFIASGQAEQREQGKQHMIWGLIGMFIMFAVYGILRLIENTLGVPHESTLP